MIGRAVQADAVLTGSVVLRLPGDVDPLRSSRPALEPGDSGRTTRVCCAGREVQLMRLVVVVGVDDGGRR